MSPVNAFKNPSNMILYHESEGILVLHVRKMVLTYLNEKLIFFIIILETGDQEKKMNRDK